MKNEIENQLQKEIDELEREYWEEMKPERDWWLVFWMVYFIICFSAIGGFFVYKAVELIFKVF